MKKGSAVLIVIGLVAILAVGGAGFFLGKNTSRIVQLDNTVKPSTTSKINDTSPTTNPQTEWRTTKLMGTYSFKYPSGWHVSDQWPNNPSKSGIGLIINPEPIGTAPRDGPPGAIFMNDLSGNNNPDEIFQNKLTETRTRITGVKEEIIKASFGDIYHFTGKVPAQGEGIMDYEEYIFTIQGKLKDNINKHVITAYSGNSSYSSLLKKIILSIKPEN